VGTAGYVRLERPHVCACVCVCGFFLCVFGRVCGWVFWWKRYNNWCVCEAHPAVEACIRAQSFAPRAASPPLAKAATPPGCVRPPGSAENNACARPRNSRPAGTFPTTRACCTSGRRWSNTTPCSRAGWRRGCGRWGQRPSSRRKQTLTRQRPGRPRAKQAQLWPGLAAALS
jgi:hypothetical protein